MGKKSLKIFVDGACSGNGTENSNTGVGIYSDTLGIKESYRFGEGSNNTAEFLAVIVALERISKEKIMRKTVIYSDSQYVIDSVRKNFNLKSPVSMVCKNFIRNKLLALPNVSLKKIPREQNTEADLLAKNGKEKQEIDSLIIANIDLVKMVREEYSHLEKTVVKSCKTR